MSMRLALICVASAAALASTAAAQPNRAPTSVFVSDAGVDFADAAETGAFYASLRRAATKACTSNTSRSLAVDASDRACARDALDRAVRTSGKSALAALHEAQTGRAAPATVLAAH